MLYVILYMCYISICVCIIACQAYYNAALVPRNASCGYRRELGI